MSRATRLMLSAFLAVSPALYAPDRVLNSREYEADQHEWRQIDTDMPPDKYREALRHNWRVARYKIAHSVVSLGVPKAEASVMGAAISVAVDDLELPLNKSKTMTLQIEDAVGGDRSAFVRIKLEW